MNGRRYDTSRPRELVLRAREGEPRRCESCAQRRTRRRMDVGGVLFAICEVCAPVPVVAILPVLPGADQTTDRTDWEGAA